MKDALDFLEYRGFLRSRSDRRLMSGFRPYPNELCWNTAFPGIPHTPFTKESLTGDSAIVLRPRPTYFDERELDNTVMSIVEFEISKPVFIGHLFHQLYARRTRSVQSLFLPLSLSLAGKELLENGYDAAVFSPPTNSDNKITTTADVQRASEKTLLLLLDPAKSVTRITI